MIVIEGLSASLHEFCFNFFNKFEFSFKSATFILRAFFYIFNESQYFQGTSLFNNLRLQRSLEV